MKKILIMFTIGICIVSSCTPSGPTQNEYDALKEEVTNLKNELTKATEELEGYRNSPDKLFANANELYRDKNVGELKAIYENIEKYHPESPEASKIKEMISKLELEIKTKKEKEEKERLAKIEKEKAERLKAVKKLKKKYDDVSGITWYENPYFTHYTNRYLTSIYIGARDEKNPWLRLRMSYYDDDWVFFERAYLSYDGNTKEILFDKYRDKETDNSGGYVWEWIDLTVDDDLLYFLQNMADGKSLKMRFVGKYTKTRNLSTNEVKGIKDVLLAYDVLKQGI